MAMLVASMVSVGVIGETADARGPEYNGSQTQNGGPAYFGPAPNPFPCCDSPTYFDPFPENVVPIGRMDVGDKASVTTDGVTMNLEITVEGAPGGQYPGFFPAGGEGDSSDQAKGIELGQGDAAVVSLSEPLFYSQWIFTDVDQENEGFTVTPAWTERGESAAFGGDMNFRFTGSTADAIRFDDTNHMGEDSESINGRVQVDFLGAVTGITMERTSLSQGQSGFAVGGGCEAAGASKVIVDGPTWNGTGFDVTYALRIRNNLPSTATIQSVINDANSGPGESFLTSEPAGMSLGDVQLTDSLADDGFENIKVTGLTTTGDLVLNQDFNGLDIIELISSGAIAAEQTEVITLSVLYTPDVTQSMWNVCATDDPQDPGEFSYSLQNQAEFSARVSDVDVTDLSDNGISAAPNDTNGEGGVDDPTPVSFSCPPRTPHDASISLIHSVSKADEDCITNVKDENSLVANSETLAITWCAKTTNNGNVALTNVLLDAPNIGSGDPIDVLEGNNKNVLLPGESVVVRVAGEIPDTGLVSDAKVRAAPSDVDGNVLTGVARPDDDSDTAEVIEASISLKTTAAAGAGSDCADAVEVLVIPSGEDMTWCFEVTNTGATTLRVTQVTDQALDITAAIPLERQNLAQGATVSVSANDVVDGPVIIDADVKGKPLGSSGAILEQAPEVGAMDSAEIVISGADLALVKEISNTDPIPIGQVVTYSLTITNNGPHAASGVRVVDELPVGMSYVSLPGNDDWACSFDGNQAGFGCDKGTDLANGASVTLSYTARIVASVPANTDLINVAEVSSDTPDSNPLNNKGEAKAILLPPTSTPTPTPSPTPTPTPTPTRQPEYPGPFPTPVPPEEVLALQQLAITGGSSNLLGMLSVSMLALGGLLTVGSRRNRKDD